MEMEIEIAFKALAFFAAFMAARSLTAYFKKSNSAAKRGNMSAVPLDRASARPNVSILEAAPST
jgi:hypothetical protein